MTALELYRRALDVVPSREVAAFTPNPEKNPVHVYYPHVAATLGVRVVVQAAWTARVEVAS